MQATATRRRPVRRATTAASSNGAVAVQRAESELGAAYVWAADDPKHRRFDCSGLAMYCYAPFKQLHHQAVVQFTQLHHRPYSEAQPGDLVFFGHSQASIFHVGIYVGGGQMISALDPAEGVRKTAVPTTARIPLVGVCPGGASSSSSSTSVADAMLAYLRNNPLTRTLNDAADSAIIGNADIESGDDPAAYNAREGAYGLFQEEGGRATGLRKYAAAHHLAFRSFEAEMGYMTHELSTSKAYVLDELRGVPNTSAGATQAGHFWQRDFEGSDPSSLGAREAHSRTRFAQIQAGGTLPGGPNTATDASFTSAADGAGGAASSFLGLGNPIAGIEKLGPKIVAWAADALLVVVGVALIVLALYLAAKSTGQDVSLNNNGGDAKKPGGDKTHHGAPIAGEAAGGEAAAAALA